MKKLILSVLLLAVVASNVWGGCRLDDDVDVYDPNRPNDVWTSYKNVPLNAKVPDGHRKNFFVGETVVIPIESEGCKCLWLKKSDDKRTICNCEITYKFEEGSDVNISLEAKQKRFLSKEEIDIYYANVSNPEPDCHWRNRQTFWMELSGLAVNTGHYEGTLTVKRTDTDDFKDVDIDFSFDVNDVPKDKKIAILTNDPAANYNEQMEIYSKIHFDETADKSLYKPYFDYYFTKNSKSPYVVFDVWNKPENTCIQVLNCGDGIHYVFRHRYRDNIQTSDESEFQLGLFESRGMDIRATNFLDEKIPNGVVGFVDYSYKYFGDDVVRHANMRNSFYNDNMALFEGKGNFVYGSSPDWYLLYGANCKEIDPENLSLNSASAGVVYNGSVNSKNLCKPGEFDVNPITIEFDTDHDVIYEGEDYFAMPVVKSTEGEILPLKIIEQEGFDWLETGSPADYWKNNYDNDVAGVVGFSKKFYIRSINDVVRQSQNMPVGTYTYKLQAKDDKGNEAVVTRTVEILDGKKYSASNSNGVAVLSGDETWFKNYQLDIATGIERYANEGETELKKGYHYDYYGQLQGNVADQKSKFNEWYSNPGFEQLLDDCGNGRYRIRYVYTDNSVWNLYYNQSYFDMKTGVVNKDESEFVKINDYSMRPFVENGVLKLNGRKYNPNIPLYDEKGNLLWGNPPEWENSCREVGKIEKKITIDFDTDSDVIYEGEDYFAMPIVKSTEGDIVSLTVVEQSDYDWLETGTPTDYWKNNYGEDVAGVDCFAKRFYVRSMNGAVRQSHNMPAKFYTYTLKAEDDKGNVTTLTRKVRILEGEKHPAANTNGLAILVGDETWFKNYQLDIATGIERYANENTIDLKKGYHYDYYGQLEGSVLNKKSMFNDWYSNPGFKQILDDCGEGRYRIRYEFVADNPWIIYFNQSYFDIKTGIVNNSQSKLVKINDYSMQPFVDAENGVLKLYGRKYNPNVPLYDEKGKLLWGNPPEWNNNCKEVGAIKDLPHDNPGGGDVIIPSDKKLTAQFYDAARTTKEQGQFNFRILNKGANDVDVGGYEMRFYYSEYENPNPVASDIAYYYSSNLPSDQWAASFSYEKCAENMYVLKIKPKDGSVAKAQGSYPEYDHIRLNAQLKNVWSDIHKSSMHSWNNANEIMDNPKMSLFDKNGFWVYGEKDLCNPIVNDDYKFDYLTAQFKDPRENNIATNGTADFSFQVANTGNKDYSIDGYEIRFFFKNRETFDASDITFENKYLANSQVTKEWCGDGKYYLKIKLGSGTIVSAQSHYPQNNPINVIAKYNGKAFDKKTLDSWQKSVLMMDNAKMGLFDADGNRVWGFAGYKCNNPITIPAGSTIDKPRFSVEETEELLTYAYTEKKSEEDDKDNDADETIEIEKGINKVSLKVKNVSDQDEEGPVYVDYFITHPDGSNPLLFYADKELASADQDIELKDGVLVKRFTVGNKHIYQFTLINGLNKKSENNSEMQLDFSLRDDCIDCVYKDEAKKFFTWNLDDDWSAEKETSTYIETQKVVILSKDGIPLYGKGDEEMPQFKIEYGGNGPEIEIPDIVVQKQNPNRTDAIAYSGGQLLSNGGFEESSLIGWDFESGSISSVRGSTVQGSRFLRLNGRISQTLPNTTLSLLLDSGAVLSFWHRSDKCPIESSSTTSESSSSTNSSSAHFWLTVPSPVIGNGGTSDDDFSFRCSHDWKKESVFLKKDRFMTNSGNVNNNYVIKLSTAFNVDFDDMVLIPSSSEQPSTYAVRFTTTQHEELETRAYDGDKSLLVTSSVRDPMGRTWYKYLPFELPCSDVESCNSEEKTLDNPSMAETYYVKGIKDYPDADGVPYTETRWKPDPVATKDVEGAPGSAFSIEKKHLVRAYSSGINMTNVDPLDFNSLASAVNAVREHRVYDDEFDNYRAKNDMNPTHTWEMNVDQNDNAAFTVKDGEGHVIVSGALKKIPNAKYGEVAYELVSRSVNELDVRGNVVKAHPPLSCDYSENKSNANCVRASEYAYDSQSRVIRSWEPDLVGSSQNGDHHGMGSTITYYDLAGRVRATQTQNQIERKTASVVIYDHLDRAIATGEWEHGYDESSLNKLREDLLSDEFLDENKDKFPTKDKLASGTVTRTYYDKEPSATEVAGLGVELHPDGVKLNYTRGRVAAVVSDAGFDDAGNVIRVSTANSYDKYGRTIASYTFDPTLPADLRMMAAETEYDLGGKILASTKYPYGMTTSGRIRSITENYTYDRLGRISDIYTKNGNGSQAVLAHYEYYPTGSVKNITMGNALKLTYTYHISGAVKTATVKSVDGKELYSETLHYEDSDKPQYNGNISRMVHQMAHGNDQYGQLRDVLYLYDELNRLTSVDDSKQDVFDEMFEYDAQGRITAQHRAQLKNGKYEVEKSGGEYFYESEKNRLKSVADNMGGISASNRKMSDPDNFIYDSEGNLTDDKSKGLKISYDWRSMPIEFLQESQPTGSSDNSLFRLTMAYDGSGRRISKTRWVKKLGSQDWEKELVTHYTGIGTEVREDLSKNQTKVVVNMPEGFGRYGVEDALKNDANVAAGEIPMMSFEWYVKNHLGSTMLVYGTQGDVTHYKADFSKPKAAYDYRAFGEMLELTPPATGKVTENFTGKEHDDEIALNYFGARYLDPMLGMWISMDPKRQFASPYLYAGNGYNPISGQDDDGGYYNDENGTAIYETAKKNDFYGNSIVKETLEWGANSPNPINVSITRKDKFDKGYPAGGITKNSYSFVSKVLDVLNGCFKPSCSNAFAPDISSSDITIYNGSYDYMQRKGGYSRAGVPIDGMPLEEWQAKTLTHEIDFHIRDDLGQRMDSENLEHRNKVKDAEMWE